MAKNEPETNVLKLEQQHDSNYWDGLMQSLMKQIFQFGPFPKHIAFIMDGNRRYARETLKKGATDGYKLGANAIFKLLHWMIKMDLEELSMFAFSIENFKRSIEERNYLFGMFENVVKQLIDIADNHPESNLNLLKLRFFGKLELLPADIQKSIVEYEKHCSPNAKKFINVYLSYTSRFEITNAVDSLTEYAINNNLDPEDITLEMVEDAFYTNECHVPEMLVRTSGEIRFSDFMLPQLNHSFLRFIDKMWPEMTGFDLIKYVAVYQYNLLYNKFHSLIQKFISSQSTKENVKTYCIDRRKNLPVLRKQLPVLE